MRALAAFASIALLVACGDDAPAGGASTSSSSSSGSASGGPPDPTVLFDALPAATPDKLRGVWETKDTGETGTLTLRLRFTDDFIAAAARCTTPAGKSLDAQNVAPLDTADIDAKEGGFALAGDLVLTKAEGDFKCTTELPGGNLAFVIEGTKLSLSLEGEEGTLDFAKVGD